MTEQTQTPEGGQAKREPQTAVAPLNAIAPDLEWSVAARQGRPVVHLAARFGGAGFLPHRFRSGKAAPARQPAAT